MRINVNGVDIFYKKAGRGRPVILLHGNGESHKLFRTLFDLLKTQNTVYAIDSRCHGQSGTGKLSYDLMADDVAALIAHEGLELPIVYGFSDGGIVGLLVAIKHPNLLSRLIISGANLHPKGLKWRFRASFFLANLVRPSKLTSLMLKEPNINPKCLSTLNLPVIVLAGKRDIVKNSHTRLIAKSLKNSKLVVLKGENHFSYVADNQKLFSIIEPYLY